MALLPLEQAIPRFKANEERVDVFTNGNTTATYTTTEGATVPSLRKFYADISLEGEGWLARAEDAATALEMIVGGESVIIAADGRTGSYPLAFVPPDPKLMFVFLDGLKLVMGTHYTIVVNGSAASGFGLQLTPDPAFPYAAPVSPPSKIELQYTRPIDGPAVEFVDDFATRAELVAHIVGGNTVLPGRIVTAAGLTYMGKLLATEIPDLAGLIPVNATPGHYGAVGDGITNDAAALASAWASGREIDHGDATYAFATTIAATLPRIRWVSNGARLRYTGAAAQYALELTVSLNGVATLSGSGMTVDGGGAAFTAFYCRSAATVPDPIANWPIMNMENLHATNYRRASLAFTGGDGIFIPGGWRSVTLTNPRASEGRMAVGADVAGAQGIFGITVGSGTLPRPKGILINGWSAENIWSEDPAVDFDQDALRIFQDMDDPTVSHQILNGDVRNVTGRAIKLHSGPNAIIAGLHRELSSAVVPQSGLYSAPDIDAQQAPANITNCRFHYDGIWHGAFVRNFTDRGGYQYGGGLTDGISWHVENAAGNTITAVQITTTAGDVGSEGPDSAQRATVANLTGTGAIANFMTVRAQGAGVNAIALMGATGEVTGNAYTTAGDATATIFIASECIVNTGAPVAFRFGSNTLWRHASGSSVFGFTGASMSSDAIFGAPLVIDNGTAGGLAFTIRGNNPRVEIYDAVGTLSTGAIMQIDGSMLHYADYYGTAAGAASHDFRVNGTASGNRALTLNGDYTATFFAPIRAAFGTEGLPGLSFSGDSTTGFYRISSNVIGAATGGTRRVTINSTGTFMTPPGAYANDAGAAAGGVAIGELYRVTGGTLAWRQV